MGDDKVKSGTSIELTRDQENFLQEIDGEEERVRREIFSTSAEHRRAELLHYYYPPEYFQSPPSGHLVACWVQSRDNFRVAENPAEKQFWAYQTKGFADEISRRLDQYPISRYVLNTIHGCQGCYKKLLQFAKKIPENTQNIDDPMKNSNYRVGRVIAKKRKEAIQKKSLVRGIFDERVGLLRPEYAVIAAACDRAFDYFPNEVEEALIWELRRKHLQECPLDSPIRADSKLTFNDILTESEELVEELENQKQISEELQLIDNPAKFTERQRQVYRLRREGATFKEIGEKLGIRRQGAQKTEKATRKKLDSYLKS